MYIYLHSHTNISYNKLLSPTVAIKVEKKEGEKTDYNKLKVKDLKKILDQRGVKCSGCTEKTEFVNKCLETEHMEM